jgi:hypothetical protein
MNKIYLLILCCVTICFTTIVNAQKNKTANKPVLKKIDTLMQPIPNGRSLFHLYIDDQIQKVDYLDGKYDNTVANYRGEVKDNIINNDIMRRAKALAIYIENESFDQNNAANNNTKIRFLRRIEKNLQTFYNDIYDGQANLDYYKDMFDKLEGYIVATKENKVEEFISKNMTMGMYLNKELFENNSKYMNMLIDSMCYKYPEVMEFRLKEIAEFKGACAVMAYIGKRSVLDVYKYASSTSIERKIVNNCDDPTVKAVREITNQTASPLKALAFFEDYKSGKRTLAEIDDMTSSDEKYYKALVKMQIDNKEGNKYILARDLKVQALNYIRTINELHDESDKIRFKVLENLNANELYYLSVLCNEEIYTSSFIKGTYANMIAKMAPLKGDEFLESISMDKFRTFIRMCANYNKLDTFLTTMNEPKRNTIMREFVSNLGANSKADLEGSVDVADAIGSIKNETLLQYLQTEIKAEYEQNYLKNNKDGLSAYFILYSLFLSKQPDMDDSIFNGIMTSKLKLQPINKMGYERLLSATTKTVYEQVFFYGDEDGRSSYDNFINFINKNGTWKTDATNKYFTKFTAINSKVPFEIYANKPLPEPEDEEAQKQLGEYLIANSISPSIMVHRGHSYHLPSTINALSEENKIVILGSCGGYHNLSTILQRSDDAHIVSSKQVGSKNVNDPIIREVNNLVMNGQDVNWINIWNKLDKLFVTPTDRDLFNDYIPPHKNLGALFLKAYKTLNSNQM